MEINNEKRKKKKSKDFLMIVLMVICFAVQALFIGMLFLLNVLPLLYAAIVVTVLALIDVAIVMLFKKGRRGSNKRLLSSIIMMVMTIVMVLGCSYLYNTLDTFSRISSDGRQMEYFHVVVMEESKYEDVKQIAGETVYVIDTESKMYAEAKEKLLTKVEVTYKEEPNVMAAAEHIINEKGELSDEIIFISEGNYQLICDENRKFKRNTKMLYTVSVAMKSDDFAKRIDVTEDPFNIYISGVDTRGEIEDVSRSDVNMIVTVNPQTRDVLITSMPRDSYVKLHTVGMMDKLTHSGIYGIDETISTVEDWLGVDINYYYRVNFKMLVKLVNALGGITVDVPKAFDSTYWDYSFKEGENHLKGYAALAFVRERKTFEDEDEERIRNQQRVLKAILKKATNSEVILTNYADILNSVEGCMQTNMSNKDITSIVKMQLKDMDKKWNIKTISIDGDDAELGTYSMGPGKPLFVSVPKEESVEKVKRKIHEVMYPAE